MAWLPRAPGLHPICSFATLVPVVVAKCTATPRRSHAGLPAPPLEITPGMFSFRVVHKSTVAALVERACSAQVTLHLVRSDKLDQGGRRTAMAAGAAMIISCTTTSAATPTAFASPFMPVPALESLKDEVCIRFVWFAMFAIDLARHFIL